jgi:DNA-binding NtrC family response regulator
MADKQRIVFIEDDGPVRSALTQTLELADLSVTACGSAEEALAAIVPGLNGIVISDIWLPDMQGDALLRCVRRIDPGIPVILITAHADIVIAVASMQDGAYDFIEKPFAPERFIESARRALERRALQLTVAELHGRLAHRAGIEALILGRSAAIADVRRRLLDLAGTDADVMITGETGTGKELAARCLHEASRRSAHHFVAINCGALPETLLESELFGHEAGAFTSAGKRRIGKVEHAHGGTLFLDEIESMPLAFQVRLLRILQERRVERLGSNVAQAVDIRVVTAAKEDLLALCRHGSFRSDLYYRLHVASVALPALRERREDIPLLFDFFLLQAACRHGRDPARPSPTLLRELLSHDWPGNVRELRNAAERHALGLPPLASAGLSSTPQAPTLTMQMDMVERILIEQALRKHRGQPAEVCAELGIARKTLYDKLHRHGLAIVGYR